MSRHSVTINSYAFKAFQSYSSVEELGELSRHVLRDFLRHQSVSNSQSTSARYYDVLAAFCKWLVNEEILDANPMGNISKPKKPEKLIGPLSVEDVNKLLSVCGKDFVGGSKQADNRLAIRYGLEGFRAMLRGCRD